MGDFTNHMDTHNPDKSMTCEECGKVYKNRKLYSQHKYRAHTDHQITCSQCYKKFKSAQELEAHLVSQKKNWLTAA